MTDDDGQLRDAETTNSLVGPSSNDGRAKQTSSIGVNMSADLKNTSIWAYNSSTHACIDESFWS